MEGSVPLCFLLFLIFWCIFGYSLIIYKPLKKTQPSKPQQTIKKPQTVWLVSEGLLNEWMSAGCREGRGRRGPESLLEQVNGYFWIEEWETFWSLYLFSSSASAAKVASTCLFLRLPAQVRMPLREHSPLRGLDSQSKSSLSCLYGHRLSEMYKVRS